MTTYRTKRRGPAHGGAFSDSRMSGRSRGHDSCAPGARQAARTPGAAKVARGPGAPMPWTQSFSWSALNAVTTWSRSQFVHVTNENVHVGFEQLTRRIVSAFRQIGHVWLFSFFVAIATPLGLCLQTSMLACTQASIVVRPEGGIRGVSQTPGRATPPRPWSAAQREGPSRRRPQLATSSVRLLLIG